MKRVIVAGSPRSGGRSAHLAEMLFEASIDERPEDELFLVPVSEVEIGPCMGCGGCREKSEIRFEDADGNEATALVHRCVFDDDMQTLYDLLDDADELVVVAPVYFSGAPAPLKCLLDRLQPYYWAWLEAKQEAEGRGADAAQAQALHWQQAKRPATLHVVGEGADPYGFAPLISEVRSSIACAGFRLERTLDWVGKIDGQGEILEEAAEIELSPVGGRKAADSAYADGNDGDPGNSNANADADAAGAQKRKATQSELSQGERTAPHDNPGTRPKLSMGATYKTASAVQTGPKKKSNAQRNSKRNNGSVNKKRNGTSGNGQPASGTSGRGKPSPGKGRRRG